MNNKNGKALESFNSIITAVKHSLEFEQLPDNGQLWLKHVTV